MVRVHSFHDKPEWRRFAQGFSGQAALGPSQYMQLDSGRRKTCLALFCFTNTKTSWARTYSVRSWEPSHFPDICYSCHFLQMGDRKRPKHQKTICLLCSETSSWESVTWTTAAVRQWWDLCGEVGGGSEGTVRLNSQVRGLKGEIGAGQGSGWAMRSDWQELFLSGMWGFLRNTPVHWLSDLSFWNRSYSCTEELNSWNIDCQCLNFEFVLNQNIPVKERYVYQKPSNCFCLCFFKYMFLEQK